MRITVKLFASLDRYLPPGSADNEARMDVEDGLALSALLARLRLPGERCHLVLVNGAFVEPRRRDDTILHADDEIAVWPQVAGGSPPA